MKTKSFFALIAAAVAFAACKPSEPAFYPEGSLSATTLEIANNGATETVTFTANASWTATSDADWIALNPESKTISDKTETTTNVLVNVGANPVEENRTGHVSFTVEGVADKYILTVTQLAAVPERKLVATATTVEFGSDEASLSNNNITIKILSTVSFTATSGAAWLKVSPANVTVENFKETYTDITLSAEVNTGDPRETTVTFAGQGVEPVVVKVTQETQTSSDPLSVDVYLMSVSDYLGQSHPSYPDYSCVVSVMENPSETIVSGYYGVFRASAWDGVDMTDIETVKGLLVANADSFTADEIDGLNGVNGADPCEWLYGNLPPDTEFIVVAYFESENGKEYVGYDTHKTDAAEVADVPEALLGNWICPSATDMWGEDTYTNWTMTLSADVGGVSIKGFDVGMDELCAANGLALPTCTAKYSEADQTLTVADKTATGIVTGSTSIDWRGFKGQYYSDIVYDVDFNANTLTLAVDGFMAVAGTSAFSGFNAPLVFYKEGHVPSSVPAQAGKAAVSLPNGVKHAVKGGKYSRNVKTTAKILR